MQTRLLPLLLAGTMMHGLAAHGERRRESTEWTIIYWCPLPQSRMRNAGQTSCRNHPQTPPANGDASVSNGKGRRC